MQITYVYSGGTIRPVKQAIPLGDDAIKEYVSGFRPDMMLEIQKSAPPRAPWKQGFGRMLGEMDVEWNVARSLTDYATNLAFVMNHMAEVFGHPAGRLTMTQDGLTSAQWTWKTALLTGMKLVELNGARSVINYRFWCTELSTSPI